MLSFKPTFSLSSFPFIKRLFSFLVPLHFLPLGWYHLHIWSYWYFSQYSLFQLEPLDEGERGEWESWLKTQHSENLDHGIQSHHFMANRWVKYVKSNRLHFLGLQNHWGWWLQPWNEKTLAPWKKSYGKPSDMDFPGGPMVKNWPANAGEMGLILGPEGSHMLWSN